MDAPPARRLRPDSDSDNVGVAPPPLPFDVWRRVFAAVRCVRTASRCARVSHAWRAHWTHARLEQTLVRQGQRAKARSRWAREFEAACTRDAAVAASRTVIKRVELASLFDVAVIARVLPRLSALHVLYLPENDMRDVGVMMLAHTLPSATALHTLCLARNGVRDVGAVALARALPACTALAHLDLSENAIGARGCSALAEALPALTRLRELELDYNVVGNAGAAALARGVESLLGLESMKLVSNAIGEAGARALARALPALAGLHVLDMSHNSLGDDGVVAVASALVAHPRLRVLMLGDMDLGDRGAAALAQLVPTLGALEQLSVSLAHDLLSRESVAALTAACAGRLDDTML